MSLRCLKCGSSEVDRELFKCNLCGTAAGLRDEQCHVSEETKTKLWRHADKLGEFGIKVERDQPLRKNTVDPVGAVALALAIAVALKPDVLRELIRYLKDTLLIPEQEILGLRLDEPEQILTYYRIDQKLPDSDLTPYGRTRRSQTKSVGARPSAGLKKGSKSLLSVGGKARKRRSKRRGKRSSK
jgi:hypothetical protein